MFRNVTEGKTQSKAGGSGDPNVDPLMEDGMRNEQHVRSVGDEAREARLRWFDMFSKHISAGRG